MMHLPAGLDGDGRCALIPRTLQHEGQSISVTLAGARVIIAALKAAGDTQHSSQAGTMWVVKEWCLLNNIDYTIESHYIDGELAGYTFTAPTAKGMK